MSRGASNIDLLRTMIRAFNASGIEGAGPFFDPDVEWHAASPRWLEKPVYRGLDGVRELADSWAENFDDYRLDEHRLRELDDGRVLGLYRQSGRIKGSSAPIEQKIGVIWEIRGGKVSRVDSFLDWEEAMEAAGVSEEALRA